MCSNCFSFRGTKSPRPCKGASSLDPTGALSSPRLPGLCTAPPTTKWKFLESPLHVSVTDEGRTHLSLMTSVHAEMLRCWARCEEINVGRLIRLATNDDIRWATIDSTSTNKHLVGPPLVNKTAAAIWRTRRNVTDWSIPWAYIQECFGPFPGQAQFQKLRHPRSSGSPPKFWKWGGFKSHSGTLKIKNRNTL